MKKVLLILLTVLCAITSSAEDSAERGRLEDGRAYRTDDQGYQLVDYVAELELKVEELQNKIIAINNEKKFQEVEGEFSETNLMPETNKFAEKNIQCPTCECPANDCPTNECPATDCPDLQCPESNCSQIESAYQEKLEQQARDAQVLKVKIAEQQESIVRYQDSANDQSDQGRLLRESQQQIARLQSQLDDRGKEIALLESRIASEQSIASRNSQMAQEHQGATESLQKELSQLKLALAQQQNTNRDLEKELITVKSKVISNAQTQVVTNSEATAPAVQFTGTVKRNSAFDHLKAKLDNELKVLENLVIKRNQLAKVYKASPIRKSIAVTLSSTVTPDGYDVRKLSEKLSISTKFSELGMLQKNLFLLTREMRKDIAILQRLTQR